MNRRGRGSLVAPELAPNPLPHLPTARMDPAVGPPELYIRLLGPLRLDCPGVEPVELAPGQTAALLAALALSLPRALPREELLERLWPGEPPEPARGRLRQLLYLLRQELEQIHPEAVSVLVSSRAAVGLDPVRVRTDVQQFQSLAEAGALQGRAALLEEAVALYRGELLPGLYHDWVLAERAHLAEQQLLAMRRLAQIYMDEGRQEAAISAARRLVAAEPLSEQGHCLLIRLLAGAGDVTAARNHYREMERLLRETLDTEPSPAARALLESLENPLRMREPPLPGEADAVAPAPDPGVSPPPADAEPRRPAMDPGRAATAALGRPFRHRSRWLLAAAACLLMGMVGLVVGLRARTAPSPPPVDLERRPLWTRRYVPAAGDRDSEPTAAVLDGHQFILVGGFLQTLKRDVDFLLLKLDPRGNLLWQHTYDGPAGDMDRARSVATGADDGAYMCGESMGRSGSGHERLSELDYALVKVDRDGQRLWEARYNGPANGLDAPVQVACLPEPEAAVMTGRSWGGTAAGYDIATVCVDASGRRRWEHRWGLPGREDRATGLAVLSGGGVCVAGFSRAAPGEGGEAVLLCYDLDGTLRWEKRVPRAAGADDHTPRLSVFGDEICLLSEAPGAEGGTSLLTVRVSAGRGEEIWRSLHAGPPGARLRPAGVLACGQGWACAVAEVLRPGQPADLRVAAFGTGGRLRWEFDSRRVGLVDAVPLGVGPALDDRFTVTGRTLSRAPGPHGAFADCLTLRFHLARGLEWAGAYDGEYAAGDSGSVVTSGLRTSAVVAAQSDSGASHDIVVLRY